MPRFWRRSADSSERARPSTWWPRFCSAAETEDPIYPVAPVTNTFKIGSPFRSRAAPAFQHPTLVGFLGQSHTRIVQHLKVLTNLDEPIAFHVFVSAKGDEGNHSGKHPKFGAPRELGFRLPAKELARDFESYQQTDGESD